MLYFFITYMRPPKDPRHEKFARWSTSFIVLLCMITVSSIQERVGIVQQLAFVRSSFLLLGLFADMCGRAPAATS